MKKIALMLAFASVLTAMKCDDKAQKAEDKDAASASEADAGK